MSTDYKPDISPPPDMFNFARHVIQLNAGRAEKVAYIDDLGELTYGELAAQIRRFGDSLRNLGLRSEQRLLILLQDSNEWPVAFLGALYAGVIPVPVNTLLTANDYAYLIDHSGASAAVVSGALFATFHEALARTSNSACQILIAAGPSPVPDTAHGGIAFTLAAFAIYLVRSFLYQNDHHGPTSVGLAIHSAVVAVMVLLACALWTTFPLSVRALRGIELTLFGVAALFFIYKHFASKDALLHEALERFVSSTEGLGERWQLLLAGALVVLGLEWLVFARRG